MFENRAYLQAVVGRRSSALWGDFQNATWMGVRIHVKWYNRDLVLTIFFDFVFPQFGNKYVNMRIHRPRRSNSSCWRRKPYIAIHVKSFLEYFGSFTRCSPFFFCGIDEIPRLQTKETCQIPKAVWQDVADDSQTHSYHVSNLFNLGCFFWGWPWIWKLSDSRKSGNVLINSYIKIISQKIHPT